MRAVILTMQVAGLKGSRDDRKKKCIIGVAEWPLRIPQLVVVTDVTLMFSPQFTVSVSLWRANSVTKQHQVDKVKLLEPTCQLHNG